MIFLCLLNTVLMTIGQLMFKYGASSKQVNSFFDAVKLLGNPIVFCAVCVYIFTTCLGLYILSKLPLSFVYPIQALMFPFVFLGSMFFFHEIISPSGWIGISFIVIGVVICSI